MAEITHIKPKRYKEKTSRQIMGTHTKHTHYGKMYMS